MTRRRGPSKENVRLTAALVAASRAGLTSREVADAVHRSIGATLERLRAAAALGLIECLSGGACARWCAPNNRDAALAAIEARKREVRRACYRRQTLSRRAKRLAVTPEEAERLRDEQLDRAIAGLQQIKQVVVPAHAAPPLPKLGPASVFELGGA